MERRREKNIQNIEQKETKTINKKTRKISCKIV